MAARGGSVSVADARLGGLCLGLFPDGGRDAILQLILELRARRKAVIAQWQTLAPARLSSRGMPTPARLRETYVAHLRRAESHLLRGDGAAFVAFAHALGACVADDGMPFAGLVAHVSLLHESCVNALADRALELRGGRVGPDRGRRPRPPAGGAAAERRRVGRPVPRPRRPFGRHAARLRAHPPPRPD